MKIKTLFFLMILSSLLSAQTDRTYIYQEHPGYMTYDDYYYHKNLRGVNTLMSDVKTIDPELYQALDPFAKDMRTKQQQANLILGVGGGVGTTMAIIGMIPTEKESEYQVLGQTRTWEEPKLNFGLIVSGTVLLMGSALVASGKWVTI